MTPSYRLSDQLRTWNREAAKEPDGLDQGKRIYWFMDHADALADAIYALERIGTMRDFGEHNVSDAAEIAREALEKLKS